MVTHLSFPTSVTTTPSPSSGAFPSWPNTALPTRPLTFPDDCDRFGTSTLESTRLIGLSNEVDPVIRSHVVRLGAWAGMVVDEPESGQRVALARGRVDLEGDSGEKRGLANEIRQVDARERDPPVDPMARHPDQFKETYRSVLAHAFVYFHTCVFIGWAHRCFRMIIKWFLWLLWRAWVLARRISGLGRAKRDEDVMGESWRAWSPGEKEDLEDEDWEPNSDDSASSDSGEGEGGDGSDGDEEAHHPSTLYQDLSSAPSNSESSHAHSSLIPFPPPPDTDAEDFTPILLAHHLRPASSTPLTRRRYRTLVPGSSSDQQSFLGAIEKRRAEVEWRAIRPEEEAEDRVGGRSCVVCLGEERCVILWPCRESCPVLFMETGGLTRMCM